MAPNDRPLRPRIIANLAMTADGKIDSRFREGGGFSSRSDRARMDQHRAAADALLVGAATIRAEDPPLFIRSAAARAARQAEGRAEQLIVGVVSRSGQIPPKARWLRDPAQARLLVVPHSVAADALEPLVESIDSGRLAVERFGQTEVDLTAFVGALAARGVQRLLVEGGGNTVAGFVEAGLLDELHLTVCPTILGGRDAPTPVEGAGWRIADRLGLRLANVERIDDELFLHWVVAGH